MTSGFSRKKTRLICLPNATNVLSQQATVGCMVNWRQAHTTGRGVSQRLLGHLLSPSCCASELVQYKHLVRPVSKPFVSRASLCSNTGIGMHFSPEHAEATATASSQEYHFPAPPQPYTEERDLQEVMPGWLLWYQAAIGPPGDS